MSDEGFYCRVEFKEFHHWSGGCPTQTLVFHHNGSSWWIRVQADWPLPEKMLWYTQLQRQSTFQAFVEAIDLGQLPLLDNTVTYIELRLTEEGGIPIAIRDGYHTETNYFIRIAHELVCTVREDPTRVIYPTLPEAVNVPLLEANKIQKVKSIAPALSTVIFEERRLAFKTIDRSMYEPGDSEHTLDEIQALAEFRGQPNIAQLVGVVVSENPYKTHPSTEMPKVIKGFLLEYYSGGSLERTIANNKKQFDSLLIKWAMQIGSALKILHDKGRAHLDLKPSNIVLDASQNAFLIDICGTWGYTWEWLSPEMQLLLQEDVGMVPSKAPCEARVATDCWAYGMLLIALAKLSDKGGGIRAMLGDLAASLMAKAPESRISLDEAIMQLGGIST